MDDKQLQDMLSRIQAPEPSQKAMLAAQREATEAFRKKKRKIFQGLAPVVRLTGMVNNIGRNVMPDKKTLRRLTGTVAVCALAVLFLVPVRPEVYNRVYNGTRERPPVAKVNTSNFSTISDNIVRSSDAPLGLVLLNKVSKEIKQAARAVSRPAPVSIASNAASNARPASPAAEPAAIASASNVAGGDPLTAWRSEAESRRLSMEQQLMAAPSMPTGQTMEMRAAGNMVAPMPMPEPMPQYYQDQGRDQFAAFAENAFVEVAQAPVSTFSIDVDTASYAFLRRQINAGQMPKPNSVRIEELVNYFDYNYPVPNSLEAPFAPAVTVIDSPWNAHKKLVHIGIKGYEVSEKPASNLVFLIDTSGSMNSPDKLPLLRNAFKLLLDNLNPDDTVAVVTYAGSAGVALAPTKAANKQTIIAALDSLQSGGGTAGAAGIEQAYTLASQNKINGGNNRVILATDGDFNVGINDPARLKDIIARKRGEGIFLSVLGFGQGNYNDAMMQSLAQNGNGNAAYIDTLNEARKVLVDESAKTLITIAKDVKIQVEFNPAAVSEYRLVGYETRHLNREDFNNDKVDAGDIGAGAAVTAIYEITPVGAPKAVDDLRYSPKDGTAAATKPQGDASEYGFVKIRYKAPNSDSSKLIETPIRADVSGALGEASEDVRFGVAVAGFGQLAANGKYTGGLTYDQVIDLANGARGKDDFGYRSEFVNLVRLAKELQK